MADPELRPGGSKDFQIGGQTLHVRPIPYGNLKKILRMVFEMSKAKADDPAMQMVTELVDKYLDQVFPLLFKAADHPFLNPAWIDENLDVPTIMEIVQAAVVVNGLKDFFPKGANLATPEKISPIQTTPPENRGSTTSSGSPTDGGQQK